MNLGTFSCDSTVQYAQQEATRQMTAMLQQLLNNPNTGLVQSGEAVVEAKPTPKPDAKKVGA